MFQENGLFVRFFVQVVALSQPRQLLLQGIEAVLPATSLSERGHPPASAASQAMPPLSQHGEARCVKKENLDLALNSSIPQPRFTNERGPLSKMSG